MSTHRWNFRLTPVRIAMMAVLVLSLVAILVRYYTGLGATTNLNDAYPWGLWIGVDMNVIALAGCGFSMAIITHIFHVKKYQPLARRTLLISFIGYILVMLILIIEIGRWDNFWRPFVSPNLHSPMFEVYMCIVAYMILQAIELLEVGAEKLAPSWKKPLSKIMPVVFVIACVVPLAHQASLGSLYLAMPAKLDGIWASQMMPWLFLLSAFFVGPAVAIVENIWSNYRYKMPTDVAMLHGLSKIAAVGMGIYLIAKGTDLVLRGQLGAVFTFTTTGNLFLLEMVTLTILPILICLLPFGKTKGGLLVFGLSTMVGLVLTRLNVVFTGMAASLGGGYFPSFIEIFSTIGLFCFAFLVYVYITENFPFFYGMAKETPAKEGFQQAIGE